MSEMGWMRYVTSCDLLWPVFGAFGQKNQRNGASRGIRAIPISVNWQNQRWSRWSLWRLGSCGTGQPWKAAWYPLKLRCNISESQQDPGFVFFRGIRSIPTCRGSWSLRCKKRIMSTRCIVLWILYQGSLLLPNEPLGYVRRDGITNQFPTSQGRIVFWSWWYMMISQE